MSSGGLTRPWPQSTPFFLSSHPPLSPQFGSGGGAQLPLPLQRAKFPPPSLLSSPFPPVLAPFFCHRARLGSLQPTGPSPLGDPCSRGGSPTLEGSPALWGSLAFQGSPTPGGSLCPQGSLTSRGSLTLCGGPSPRGGRGGPPESQDRGRGTPSGPPRFWGSPHPPTPPQPQVLGVSQVWGGRRPPALTQPCSCSAPGRGRSPAAASLALVGGGIN